MKLNQKRNSFVTYLSICGKSLRSASRPEDSSDEAEDADKTSDESEESVLSNAVQLQGPSPSLDRPHGSRSDMEESSDNSR